MVKSRNETHILLGLYGARYGGGAFDHCSSDGFCEACRCIIRHFQMAIEGIKDSLRQRGVRLTRQRQILLELIDKSGQHLDAERLYLLAKERDPKLNRVTVYRTLKMLKAGGLVDELDLMHIGGDQHF